MKPIPPNATDIDFLLAFAKHVRSFAAGHTRGGLGQLHRDAGRAVRVLEQWAGAAHDAQLPLPKVEA